MVRRSQDLIRLFVYMSRNDDSGDSGNDNNCHHEDHHFNRRHYVHYDVVDYNKDEHGEDGTHDDHNDYDDHNDDVDYYNDDYYYGDHYAIIIMILNKQPRQHLSILSNRDLVPSISPIYYIVFLCQRGAVRL